MEQGTYFMKEDTYKPTTFYSVLVFGVLFFAAGIFFLYCFLVDISEYYTFKNAIPTKISYVEYIKLREGALDGTYFVETKYNYVYRGENYTGTRASIYRGSDNLGSFQRDLYQRILLFKENGGELFCYINAKNPNESVIDNSFRPSIFILQFIFFVICFGVGGYYILSAVKWKKKIKNGHD